MKLRSQILTYKMQVSGIKIAVNINGKENTKALQK
jgi:hypothetical protein